MIYLSFTLIILLLSCCFLHCGYSYTDYANVDDFEASSGIIDIYTSSETMPNDDADNLYKVAMESLGDLGLNISDNQLLQAEDSSSAASSTIKKKLKSYSNLSITTERQMNQNQIREREREREREIVSDIMMNRFSTPTTTTSIPNYIQKTMIEQQTSSDAQDDLQFSTAQYEVLDNWPSSLSQRTVKQTVEHNNNNNNTKPSIMDNNYSSITREIVPLTMKYYAAEQQEMDNDSNNDSNNDLKQKDKDKDNDNNNVGRSPVAMPQQHLWQHNNNNNQPEDEQFQLKNNSQEYYEFEDVIKQSSPKHTITISNNSNGVAGIETRTQLSTPSLMQAQQQRQQQQHSREEFAGLRTSMLGDAWSTSLTMPTTTTTTFTTPDINIFTTTLSNLATYTGEILYEMASEPPPIIGIATTTITSNQRMPIMADKKGKQIPISASGSGQTTTKTTTSRSNSRRRLLPHEQLRNYIEDAYIRMPLAVIVDPSSSSLEKSKSLWNDALNMNTNIQIVLITLNGSGVPAAFNFNNTHQFLSGLNSIKERKGGDAFVGILHASDLVPYDSAVFISTAALSPHTDLVQNTAITLLKKRIRLYLMWFGERALSENETQESVGGILGEVALRSGGEILHIINNENYQEIERSTLTIVAEALRGPQEIEVPVDTTLSSLHVKIDKLMKKAIMETPSGG